MYRDQLWNLVLLNFVIALPLVVASANNKCPTTLPSCGIDCTSVTSCKVYVYQTNNNGTLTTTLLSSSTGTAGSGNTVCQQPGGSITWEAVDGSGNASGSYTVAFSSDNSPQSPCGPGNNDFPNTSSNPNTCTIQSGTSPDTCFAYTATYTPQGATSADNPDDPQVIVKCPGTGIPGGANCPMVREKKK